MYARSRRTGEQDKKLTGDWTAFLYEEGMGDG